MTPDERDAAPKRQRIAKLMARAGLCSRRDAEAWIVEGRVSVNGETLTSPARDVGADDTVLVDGAPLPAVEKTRLFLFHKPRGLVTSDHDPEGRATVADYLREHWPEGPRVVTIGRLDINTEGLLLLTNDGGLARTLELPQTGWVRRYRVRAKGTADVAALEALADGVTIDGIDYAGIEAKLDRVQGANAWLTMGLREGKNREIKRVLEHLGLEVNRLIRLSFGPFQLLDLPEGAVEEVRTRVLRDQLGEKLAAQAGADFDGDAAPAREPHDAGRKRPAQRAREMREPRAERGSRPNHRSKSDGKPWRENDRRDETPPPKRERPLAGTRKHVSTLRAAEDEAAQRGPRRRIERTATQDRHDRTVRVERMVSARPSPPARARRRDEGVGEEFRDNERGARREPGRGRRVGGATPRTGGEPGRGDRSGSRDKRRNASPSAQGKRARVARSGPREAARDRDERRGERSARSARAADGATTRHRTSSEKRGDAPPRDRHGARRGSKPSGAAADAPHKRAAPARRTKGAASKTRQGGPKRGAPNKGGRPGGTRPKPKR